MENFYLYLDDLNENAQKRFFEFAGIKELTNIKKLMINMTPIVVFNKRVTKPSLGTIPVVDLNVEELK